MASRTTWRLTRVALMGGGTVALAAAAARLVNWPAAVAFFTGGSTTSEAAAAAAAAVVVAAAGLLLTACAWTMVSALHLRAARVRSRMLSGVALLAALALLVVALIRRESMDSLCCAGAHWQLQEALKLGR